MFDRAASAAWQIGAAPHVDIAALRALATLLQDVTPASGTLSQMRDSSAALGSHDRIGEMSMPRQLTTYQFDLFSNPHDVETRRTPQWQTLPAETRRTLTKLMVRLILDHADGDLARERQRDAMMSEKIRPHHLERKAILYVRQSSAHQVLHNRESSACSMRWRDRLTALGWSRIETVDDDLGRSAAGGVTRAGFDRMVAEVCLGKVGAGAAREVSRFARNSRD